MTSLGGGTRAIGENESMVWARQRLPFTVQEDVHGSPRVSLPTAAAITPVLAHVAWAQGRGLPVGLAEEVRGAGLRDGASEEEGVEGTRAISRPIHGDDGQKVLLQVAHLRGTC